MDSYEKNIMDLANSNSKVVFDNEGADHAEVVLRNIIKNANSRIFMYTGSLSGETLESEKLSNELKAYLNKENTIFHIIHEEDTLNTNSLFYETLKPFIDNKKVIIKKSNCQNGKGMHFCVADSKMLRLENDPIQFKALCSFNLPVQAKKLEEKFESCFNAN
jgi:hypothetical protein